MGKKGVSSRVHTCLRHVLLTQGPVPGKLSFEGIHGGRGGPRPRLPRGDAHREKRHSDRVEGRGVQSWALQETEVRRAGSRAQDNKLGWGLGG